MTSDDVKRKSIIKSLIEAGYNRAEIVFDEYIENKAQYVLMDIANEDFNLQTLEQSFLTYYLADGRPNPNSMMNWAWPDNLNQIFCDNFCEVTLDNTFFECENIENVINRYLTIEEQWAAVKQGAEQFIIDNYGQYYLQS